MQERTLLCRRASRRPAFAQSKPTGGLVQRKTVSKLTRFETKTEETALPSLAHICSVGGGQSTTVTA